MGVGVELHDAIVHDEVALGYRVGLVLDLHEILLNFPLVVVEDFGERHFALILATSWPSLS